MQKNSKSSITHCHHHHHHHQTIPPRVCRIKSPHSKPKKLPKNAENRQEMWAAMTRSLEMIVALFEYYSVSVVAPDSALEETSASNENRYQLLAYNCIQSDIKNLHLNIYVSLENLLEDSCRISFFCGRQFEGVRRISG